MELLVAIALFSILVSIASGGFVRALRSEREVSAMMSAESNVGIALEEMTREMRTGYLFCHDPGSDTPSVVCDCYQIVPPSVPACQPQSWTCSNIEFYNAAGEKVDYILPAGGGILERSDDAENGGALTALMSGNVSTTYLSFTMFGNLEAIIGTPHHDRHRRSAQ